MPRISIVALAASAALLPAAAGAESLAVLELRSRLPEAREGRMGAASVATGGSAEELDAALPAAVGQLFAPLKGAPARAERLVTQEPTREEREAVRSERSSAAGSAEFRLWLPMTA